MRPRHQCSPQRSQLNYSGERRAMITCKSQAWPPQSGDKSRKPCKRRGFTWEGSRACKSWPSSLSSESAAVVVVVAAWVHGIHVSGRAGSRRHSFIHSVQDRRWIDVDEEGTLRRRTTSWTPTSSQNLIHSHGNQLQLHPLSLTHSLSHTHTKQQQSTTTNTNLNMCPAHLGARKWRNST